MTYQPLRTRQNTGNQLSSVLWRVDCHLRSMNYLEFPQTWEIYTIYSEWTHPCRHYGVAATSSKVDTLAATWSKVNFWNGTHTSSSLTSQSERLSRLSATRNRLPPSVELSLSLHPSLSPSLPPSLPPSAGPALSLPPSLPPRSSALSLPPSLPPSLPGLRTRGSRVEGPHPHGSSLGGYHEGRRCLRVTYSESYITRYTRI